MKVGLSLLKLANLFIEPVFIIFVFIAVSIVTVTSFLSADQKSNWNIVLASVQEVKGGPMNVVHILKDSTVSYDIKGAQTELIGVFDTTYTILGNSESLNSSKGLIVSTIQDDFNHSPTVGYIRSGNPSNVSDTNNQTLEGLSLPNPFADIAEINQTINEHVSDAIGLVDGHNFRFVTVKCDFDMNIEDWECIDHGE